MIVPVLIIIIRVLQSPFGKCGLITCFDVFFYGSLTGFKFIMHSNNNFDKESMLFLKDLLCSDLCLSWDLDYGYEQCLVMGMSFDKGDCHVYGRLVNREWVMGEWIKGNE